MPPSLAESHSEYAFPSSPELERQVKKRFRDHFGHHPDYMILAPGRVNVIGEHVDCSEGPVLPAAIERWIGAALRSRADDGMIRCAASSLARSCAEATPSRCCPSARCPRGVRCHRSPAQVCTITAKISRYSAASQERGHRWPCWGSPFLDRFPLGAHRAPASAYLAAQKRPMPAAIHPERDRPAPKRPSPAIVFWPCVGVRNPLLVI